VKNGVTLFKISFFIFLFFFFMYTSYHNRWDWAQEDHSFIFFRET